MLAVIGYISGVFGIVAVLASAAVVWRSSLTKETIKVQSDHIDALTKRISALEKSDKENQLTIGKLQAEVNTFKNVPLKEIVEMQKQILNTQNTILELLKGQI